MDVFFLVHQILRRNGYATVRYRSMVRVLTWENREKQGHQSGAMPHCLSTPFCRDLVEAKSMIVNVPMDIPPWYQIMIGLEETVQMVGIVYDASLKAKSRVHLQ